MIRLEQIRIFFLKRRLLFGIGALVIVCGGLSLAAISYMRSTDDFALSAGREVVLTKQGFVPNRLVIQQGDTVVFKNNLSDAFWPASHPHPTHTTYARFDPKRPIEEGASWEFTFTHPGVWKYHDHLASRYEGEIIVLDNKGGVVRKPCPKPGAEVYACFEEDVIEQLTKHGLDAALDRMALLYEQSETFKTLCHSITHTLGEAGYEQFASGKSITLTGKTSYCSYGFYHGFMEAMLQNEGSVDEARRFCSSTGDKLSAVTTNAEGACYHGIGHGAVDGGDPRDWGNPKALVDPGLSLCEQVDASPERFYRCASGAFNSLALMYVYNEYNLKANEDSLYDVCLLWGEDRIRRPCYFEMNMLLMRRTGGDLQKAIPHVEKIEDRAHAAFAMKGVSGVLPAYMSGPDSVAFEQAVAICRSARADLQVPCIEGIAIGLMEVGKPGEEYVRTLSFCSSPGLNDKEVLACKKTAFSSVRAYYSKDKQAAICATIEPSLRPYCVEPNPRID